MSSACCLRRVSLVSSKDWGEGCNPKVGWEKTSASRCESTESSMSAGISSSVLCRWLWTDVYNILMAILSSHNLSLESSVASLLEVDLIRPRSWTKDLTCVIRLAAISCCADVQEWIVTLTCGRYFQALSGVSNELPSRRQTLWAAQVILKAFESWSTRSYKSQHLEAALELLALYWALSPQVRSIGVNQGATIFFSQQMGEESVRLANVDSLFHVFDQPCFVRWIWVYIAYMQCEWKSRVLKSKSDRDE